MPVMATKAKVNCKPCLACGEDHENLTAELTWHCGTVYEFECPTTGRRLRITRDDGVQFADEEE